MSGASSYFIYLERFREYLEKVAVVVVVHKNLQFLQLVQILSHLQYVKYHCSISSEYYIYKIDYQLQSNW